MNAIRGVVVSVLLGMAAGGQAATCSDWVGGCDLGLVSNTNQASGYTNYYFADETEHFSYFINSTSKYASVMTSDMLDFTEEKFECGYNYYICELGLKSPLTTNKCQVYLGASTSSGGSKGYVTVQDLRYNPTYFTNDTWNCLYVIPQHEFFHVIQT